jgi:tetratricopeptide (TPR) repeat protein
MKYLFIALLFTLSANAQNSTQYTIEKANELVTNKKYETAFNLLDSLDPKNGNLEIVLAKEDIALRYFVQSMNHQYFCFKDIPINEDLMDYRINGGSFSIHPFAINNILDSLTKLEPNNCKLYKGLGDYYKEVLFKYNGNWIKDENETITLVKENYRKAVDGGCEDYLCYFTLASFESRDKNYDKSTQYYLKSIYLNNKHADSYYNLAFAYINLEEPKNALFYAKRSLELYNDTFNRSDAANMLGHIYSELKDDSNAIFYYELANLIYPDNYENLRTLLNIYIKTQNSKSYETMKSFYKLDPALPSIYEDIGSIYLLNKKQDVLIAFFKDQLVLNNKDEKICGNLNLYLGKTYLYFDNKKEAKKYFINSKMNFIKVFEKDHEVFDLIEDAINTCDKKTVRH